jgi:hypothetical protein
MRVPASYRGLGRSLGRYWKDYGGWRDFFKSPLLHVSVLIAASSYSVWRDGQWVDLPLSLLPNLLGFSLGSYALIFSLANENLLAALNQPSSDGGPTLLRMINATFLHFILIQTIAIVFALINRSSFLVDVVGTVLEATPTAESVQQALVSAAGAFGYWLTIYAVVLLIGAALAAYRLAIMSGRAAMRPSPSPAADPEIEQAP